MRTKISKQEIFPFKLHEIFVNEIRNDEENINNEIFKEYFWHQYPSFLVKNLLIASQVKNNQTANKAVHSMNELRNAVIRK